jgi:hypothetical protein
MPEDFTVQTWQAVGSKNSGGTRLRASHLRFGLSGGEPQKYFFCQPLPCLYRMIFKGIHLTSAHKIGSSWGWEDA